MTDTTTSSTGGTADSDRRVWLVEIVETTRYTVQIPEQDLNLPPGTPTRDIQQAASVRAEKLVTDRTRDTSEQMSAWTVEVESEGAVLRF